MLAKATKTTEPSTPAETNVGTVNLEKVEVLTDNMGDWCTKEAQQHLLNLKAYYRVASRRIMENVPMKIQFAMLRQLSINIQNEVSRYVQHPKGGLGEVEILVKSEENMIVRCFMKF